MANTQELNYIIQRKHKRKNSEWKDYITGFIDEDELVCRIIYCKERPAASGLKHWDIRGVRRVVIQEVISQ